MRTDDLRHRPPDSWFTDSSSSASSTPTDDGPFLQCALCRDRYNRPKVLPCLHTFCEGCLISHTPKDSLTLTCPICRHQSILPKNGVMGLQDNLIVSSITGVLEPRKDKKHYNNASKSYTNNESYKYLRNEEKLKELPPIEENVKEQKIHLRNLLSKATSHIPVLKEDIRSIALVVENLNQNHHQAKSDMFHCLEDLESTLKDKKTQLTDELDKIHKEKYDVLQQQKHLLEMCLSSLEEHCHSAEEILTHGSDEELALVYCEMAEKLEDFVETDLQKSPIESDFVAYDTGNTTEVRAKLKCLEGVRTCRASPCESILEADTSKTFEIGDTLTWILAIRDSRGLSTDVDPLILTINLRTPGNSEVTPEIINKNGGNYVINYIARCKGVYGLTVKFHGQHVRGSPYLLTCSSKQQSDGSSAKLHRQTITESLYLAANKSKELRALALSRHIQEPQKDIINNKLPTKYDSSFDKHYKQHANNVYENHENIDYEVTCMPPCDKEKQHPEAPRNSVVDLIEIEPTRMYSSHSTLNHHENENQLIHTPSYNKHIPERPCSPTRKVKDSVEFSKFHSNIGSPRLRRAHQDLNMISNKSFESSHSLTPKSKGMEEPSAVTHHGQHAGSSPHLPRSHQSHAVITNKHNEKQQVENNNSPAYKTRSHVEGPSTTLAGSPPRNRLQKPQDKNVHTSHSQQIRSSVNSPITRRREIVERSSSPKFQRNTTLRNSYRDTSTRNQLTAESSHSPTCRHKAIEIPSPKLYRQHSLRNPTPGKVHQTDIHSRREQHTPSPTRKYKEAPAYHSEGSPRSDGIHTNYKATDKPRGEEAIKTFHSPSCRRRESPISIHPRQSSISSSCSSRATPSRDASPDKFVIGNRFENSYESCDADLETLSRDAHRAQIPHQCSEDIKIFNDVFCHMGVEKPVELMSPEMNEPEMLEDEPPSLIKPSARSHKDKPEDIIHFYPENCIGDDNIENGSVNSSCEATFGPVDNDLLIKIGRRGSKKGEFINLQGVCCTDDNKIIVADSNNQCVQVFDNEGNFLLRFGSRGRCPGQMQRPTGVAVTPSGNYLVADYENHCVNVFKPDGEYCKRFGSKKLLGPRGLTVTKDGNIIVVDNKASCLYVMQGNGKILGKIGAPGCGKGRFSGPHYVALDTSNRLVITDFHNHQVHIFLLDGTHVATFGSNGEGNGQFNAPTGVAVDSQDNIIVADWGNNRLQVFDSNGSFLSFVNTSAEPVFGPQDLALTNDGHVVVADSGNHCLKIYKYLQ